MLKNRKCPALRFQIAHFFPPQAPGGWRDHHAGCQGEAAGGKGHCLGALQGELVKLVN